MRIAITYGLGIAGVLVLGGVASAATLKVPQQFETIQAAVDAAEDGDTISIAPGQYFENVVLTGKNRIRFAGKKVIWDGHVNGTRGDCLTATGDGITVQGIRFRNGGNQIVINGNDATVSKCVMRGAGIDGVVINGDDAAIVGSTVRGANNDGIDIGGTNARIIKTRVFASGSNGIDVDGARAAIERCIVNVVEDGDGIQLNGDDCEIIKCTVKNTDAAGIDADGDNLVVERCRVSASEDPGIEASGANFRIVRNRIDTIVNDSAGIDIDDGTGTSGGLIEKNIIFDTSEEGILLDANGATVRSNKIFRAGSEQEAGIEVSGDDNELLGNQIVDADGDGIELRGNNNRIIACRITSALKDGIDIEFGTGNRIERCSATDCDGEGIDNGGQDTIAKNNKLRDNRIDVANENNEGATFAEFSGNSFKTGGTDTQAEID